MMTCVDRLVVDLMNDLNNFPDENWRRSISHAAPRMMIMVRVRACE